MAVPVVRHNVPVNARGTAPLLLLAGALLLGGCASGTASTPSAESSASLPSSSTSHTPGPATSPTRASTSPTPTPPTSSAPTAAPTRVQTVKVPHGIRLTRPGTDRAIGQRATVAWVPHKGVVGVVVIKVTAVDRVPVSRFHNFVLDGPTRRSTPYFVHGTVANIGRTDLSGYAVPLYLLDRRQTLVEASSFKARFKACRSQPFPRHFRHGVRVPVCLVYFAPNHARAKGVTFRPTRADLAIRWLLTPGRPGH